MHYMCFYITGRWASCNGKLDTGSLTCATILIRAVHFEGETGTDESAIVLEERKLSLSLPELGVEP